MTSTHELFTLQEIDLRRDARRALIADIESRLGETDDLIDAREAVEAYESQLARYQREQRDLDGQMQDLDAKIGPIEKKLYDGSVRNPKELTGFQKELDSLKKHRGDLDDKGIALIESLDRAAKALAEAQDELRRVEEYWKADQEELRANKARAEKEAKQLDAERAEQTQRVSPSSLGLYENLRRAKQGRGVARLERTTCQGCRITLPSNLVQRVRAGGNLLQCPNCERILVAG